MLSQKQTNMFWRLFARAADEACPNGSKVERENYRHKVLKNASGFVSIKDLDNTGFEKVMEALAVDANDYEEAAYWRSAENRRYYEMTKQCARQIGEITDRYLDESYFAEMFHRTFVPWDQIDPEEIFKVFAMLDTHRRRLLRKAGWGHVPEKPLSFYIDRIYIRASETSIDYYDPTSAADFI